MTRYPKLALAIAAALAALPSFARADGLIVIPNPPPPLVHGHFRFAPLEVVYHKVECDIQDQVATTSVDQEFFNPNSAVLEGEYLFPVPKNARIDKFTMDIDGKPVEAELLPADKARAIYTEIVRKTKDPALLEYAGRELFKVRIFPIEAQGKKRIRLKYTELLKSDNGLLDYHYTLNTEKFSAKPLKNVSIKVTVHSGEPLTTLYSPTHDVEVTRKGEKEAVVGYEAKDVRPDTDFHLYIGRKAAPEGGVGISVLTFRPEAEKEGYFVLLATPTVSESVKPLPKDVIFVMDTSGSMSGEKIEQARKALTYCVQTLNKEDRFNVIRFSTEAEPLFEGLQEASGENRKKATEFAAGLRAAGGTAIDEALLKALGNYAAFLPPANNGQRVRMLREVPTHLPLVVFLTDGQPTVGEQNPDKILQHVKEKMGDVPIRVFSFGVGNDVNTKLLDLVAEQTRGYSQYVLPNENIELSMSNFWGKVQDPVLANLKVTAGDVRLTQVYPSELPDLFKGDQLVAFGTYNKAGSTAITLTGTAGGKEQTFAQDVTFAEKTGNENEWIARLWATRRVGYLLDEIRLHGENKELKDEVVNLSRRWGVVTPYTAMLIIEDEQKRNVPVAQRTMREMEFDQKASARSNDALFALRRQEAVGGMSVSNSVNTAGYRGAKNLEDAQMAAAQMDSRTNFAGQGGAAMARAGEYVPAATAAPTYGGQTVAATTPVDKAALNLGTQTSYGWQVAADPAKDLGYRVINNYAQQTRLVNNRSFFLNGNQWTEARVQALQEPKHVKVVFNSDDYFALLAAHPEAAPYFALGNNVTLELGGTVYDIVEETTAPPTPK